MTEVARIAMWSGPRTLSTALMRAFENRPDTVVVDEPLYGYYLDRTGISHPGRDEILRSMPLRWPEVIDQLASDQLPAATTIYYAKHMSHHLLPEVDRAALAGMRHAFLIRDPRRLLASYAKVRDTPTLADLGLAQQVEIFRLFGGPVIDAADLAAQPGRTLTALCAALDIPFDPSMLAWPPGPRPTDGVWAKHWYARVWRSTGFVANQDSGAPVEARSSTGAGSPALPPETPALPSETPALSPELETLAALCRPFYDELLDHRLGLR
jgi:Sulfotransferase domain